MPSPRATLLALVVAVSSVLAAPAPARADDTDDLLAKLAVAADCGNRASVHRAWCPAVGWAKGKPGPLKRGFMAGVTVAITADADVGQALTNQVRFVILAVGKDGPQFSAALRDVQPETDEESVMVAKAVFGVAAVLKAKAKRVTLPPGLRAFADSLTRELTRALRRGQAGWTWTTDANTAELRRVGGFWVVIEAPKDGGAGRFVTVLTDKVK